MTKIKDKGNYHRTSEKNHGSADVREYYQTNSISWLNGKEKWEGIKSIGIWLSVLTKVFPKKDITYQALIPIFNCFHVL
ncbi:MAG: hypothetical protein K2H01_03525 [Ruminococcus sp.]|nr:hypothetical protein [Ruminococcus sp.]